MAMQLPHEILAVLLKYGHIEKIIERVHMDPLSLEHLLHVEQALGVPVVGLAFWGDGAPTQWDRSESIDVISMSLLGSVEFKQLRIPLLAFPHSKVCAETWMDIFSVIEWSLIVMATGVWPTTRHDGSAFDKTDDKTDSARKTPRRFPRAAAV